MRVRGFCRGTSAPVASLLQKEREACKTRSTTKNKTKYLFLAQAAPFLVLRCVHICLGRFFYKNTNLHKNKMIKPLIPSIIIRILLRAVLLQMVRVFLHQAKGRRDF